MQKNALISVKYQGNTTITNHQKERWGTNKHKNRPVQNNQQTSQHLQQSNQMGTVKRKTAGGLFN